MVRLLLAIVMTALLPLQGLAVPHCHAGDGNPPGHNETPHFHLGGHSHGHIHHSHDQPVGSSDEQPAEYGDDISLAVEGVASKTTSLPSDGDHTAVYVSSEISLAPQQKVMPSLDWTCLVGCLELPAPMRADHCANSAMDSVVNSCGTLPLYMATLALRL